jgi:hypothetical protein
MRNKIFYLTTFLFFFFLSCSKTKETSSVKSLVDEVLLIENQAAQRIAFSEILNPREKSQLFIRRIDAMIIDNTFTKEQLYLIQQLRSKITPAIYKNNEGKELFMREFGNAWIKTALQKIDETIIYSYLVNMSDVNSKKASAALSSDCNCNRSSSFSCMGRDECRNSSCGGSSYGCGFGWLWACNGRCSLIVRE